MRGLIRGTLLGITFCSLVAGLLAYNSKVAWVTTTEYTVEATDFSESVKCISIRYTGHRLGHEIVTGSVSVFSGTSTSGGYLMRANYGLLGRMFDTVETSWGEVSNDGYGRRDDDQKVAGACGKAM